MIIFHIITRLDPGGSSYICKKMAEGLREKGYNTFLFSGKGKTGHTDSSVELKFLKREINPFFDLLAIAEIWLILMEKKPDIVHLHSSKAGFAGRIAARLAGIKNVYYQPHGIIFYGYFSKFKSSIIKIIECLLAPLSKKIIVLTETARKEFLSHKVGRSAQYEVINNGINIGKAPIPDSNKKEKIRNKYNIDDGEIVLAMAGRIVKLKGHEYFIEVLERLIKNNYRVKGLIVGEGEYTEILKKIIARKGLTEHIIFTGYLKDIFTVLPAADILLQPSIVEGFGLSVIEAAACGIPAVGFKVGGI
ncbi:MAG: glycosyltransferase, partial [Elusimicrobia bacterium]|nr:glycosyltransferase [Elusimicrobiota bacterium]